MTALSMLDKLRLHYAKAREPFSKKLYGLTDYHDKCVISLFDTEFAILEEITVGSVVLTVRHFSVHDRYRGCDIGEKCLRIFAKRVREFYPKIQTIEFELSRAPTSSAHKKIADARKDLLSKIGALGVTVSTVGPTNNQRFEVKGKWARTQW